MLETGLASRGADLHGNHLHMSSLQIPVKLVLIGLDDLNILFLDTELSAMKMFTQACRFNLSDACPSGLLLRVCESQTLSAFTHVEDSTGSHVPAGKGRRGDMGGSRPGKSRVYPRGLAVLLYAKHSGLDATLWRHR